eukprot:scaffold78852_cov66-Phaeocystis_antarctica.AAC.1
MNNVTCPLSLTLTQNLIHNTAHPHASRMTLARRAERRGRAPRAPRRPRGAATARPRPGQGAGRRA